MKPLLLLLGIAISCTSFSQTYQAVQLLSVKTKLNSSMGTSMWGGNRSPVTTEMFTIPPNTVSCYYSFTTSIDSAALARLNLAANIGAKITKTALAASGGIVTSIVASQIVTQINIPAGQRKINVCLYDAANAITFRNNPAQAVPQAQGNIFDALDAKVPFNLPAGPWYIGLMNTDRTHATFVTVEVVAIIKTDDKVVGYNNPGNNQSTNYWTEDYMKKLRDGFTSLALYRTNDSLKAQQVAGCILNTITSKYTAADWHAINKDERINFVKQNLPDCYSKVLR